jgi:hypothetical protein
MLLRAVLSSPCEDVAGLRAAAAQARRTAEGCDYRGATPAAAGTLDAYVDSIGKGRGGVKTNVVVVKNNADNDAEDADPFFEQQDYYSRVPSASRSDPRARAQLGRLSWCTEQARGS